MNENSLWFAKVWRSGAVVLLPALMCAVCNLSVTLSLLAGILAALLGWNRNAERSHSWAHCLLQWSVIGLGAGVNFPTILHAGADGLLVTMGSITAVILFGMWMGRRIAVPRHTACLISVGTAICGGSAIAAAAGVLRPRSHETASALGVVFALNGIALFLFPWVGHALHMSETAFGWWAALSIHDTSSVVGAGLAYGPTALGLATTIKLARALWIVPVTILLARVEAKHAEVGDPVRARRVSVPWFILGFLALALVMWLFPPMEPAGQWIAGLSRRGLSATLFLIGAGLSSEALRAVGWKPVVLGVSIWLPTAAVSLLLTLLCYS
ncbi:YeiH family protein [Coraliomargarita parva]|uniref:YeiH family protein n=1 Tax=Coraliomargarita parva TaxID=3014050 RepID=UPI0022B493F5|nr:putative sulfate exporter family transporter [Coraliomargarita parva]